MEYTQSCSSDLAEVIRLLQNDERGLALATLAGMGPAEVNEKEQLEELGRLLMSKKDFDAAAMVHRRLTEALPQDGRAHNTLAASLISAGWLEAGLSELELAVQCAPDSFVYQANLGKAMMLNNQWGPALAQLEAAQELAICKGLPEGDLPILIDECKERLGLFISDFNFMG